MDILIPHNLLFGDRFPACLTQTWLQLRSLAGEAGLTPSFSSEGLARLTGKSLATLYRHLRRLKDAGLLDWRCLASELQISFELQPASRPEQADPIPAAGTEPPADSAPQPQACRTGEPPPASSGTQAARFANLRPDSQNCICASLKLLTNSLN